MNSPVVPYSDREIVASRPAKNPVDPERPYAFFVEPECSAAGRIEDVATVFLTNRECPYRCLMCDLWQNTTDTRVPPGAIPRQIERALAQLPPARQIKLYNSGNFFDAQAIPRDDFPAIARRVAGFANVVVENHPRLCGSACVDFRHLLTADLELALGLETIHPDVLPALNKQMTKDDFARAVEFLLRNGIAVRAFVLLKPPYLSEAEGIEWALRSIEFAFELGVGCCSVIPTRSGNGIMQQLESRGQFCPPTLASLEATLEQGLGLARGRVFADLWEVERLAECPRCRTARADRLRKMNLAQQVLPRIACDCETRQ